MKTNGLEETATPPYLEPDESNLHIPTLYLWDPF